LLSFGTKTLEYDLAHINSASEVLITEVCRHEEALRRFVQKPAERQEELTELLDSSRVDEDTRSALEGIAKQDEKKAARFATFYSLCVDGSKGEHAFDLEYKLRKDVDEPEGERSFKLPKHIARAIEWACRADLAGD
jgi:hypothetical protein